jgi:hypothetical protein
MKSKEKFFRKNIVMIMEKRDINMEEFGNLSKFDTLHSSELKDYMYLSKLSAHLLIAEFLEKGIKVICNLTDREGKIGEEIISVVNDLDSDFSILKLKNGKFTKLHDKFLYNINFINKKSYYSLTIQDEYFEKIIIDK